MTGFRQNTRRVDKSVRVCASGPGFVKRFDASVRVCLFKATRCPLESFSDKLSAAPH
jgi:hypothetical protein